MKIGEKCSTGPSWDAWLKCDACGDQLASCTQIRPSDPNTKNGVRGLMLDMYDIKNYAWLCHSFGGNCYCLSTSHQCKEVQAFLEANPSEVITIIIEEYVKSPNGLSKVFSAAGLTKCWFPASQMPRNGGDWPLLSDMISKNQAIAGLYVKISKGGK